jgi:hypothetical protein
MAMRRGMAAATRVVSNTEGEGGKGSKGKGYSNKGGGQRRGR